MGLKEESALAHSERRGLISKNRELEIRAEGLITMIRLLSSPYNKKIIQMDTEKIEEHARQLNKTIKEMLKNKQIIDRITEDLGDGEDC